MSISTSKLTFKSIAERYPPRVLGIIVIAAAVAMIFMLDVETETAPVQHLYYLPIIMSAIWFGGYASFCAAFASILLYHLANHPRLSSYRELDIIQMILFIAVAALTTKLSSDARRLRQLAMTDDLTGLHNLRSFEAHLTAMVKTARLSGGSVTILAMDVDHLKSINDRFGHVAGAQAVRLVGRTIAALIPDVAVACRYGGDEFAIVVPEWTSEQAEEFGNRLTRAVRRLAPILAGHRLPPGTLSISVGIATRDFSQEELSAEDRSEQEAEDIFRSADQALYDAKEAGRDRTRIAEVQ